MPSGASLEMTDPDDYQMGERLPVQRVHVNSAS